MRRREAVGHGARVCLKLLTDGITAGQERFMRSIAASDADEGDVVA